MRLRRLGRTGSRRFVAARRGPLRLIAQRFARRAGSPARAGRLGTVAAVALVAVAGDLTDSAQLRIGARILWPITGCCSTTWRSSAVSVAGFERISFGIPILLVS